VTVTPAAGTTRANAAGWRHALALRRRRLAWMRHAAAAAAASVLLAGATAAGPGGSAAPRAGTPAAVPAGSGRTAIETRPLPRPLYGVTVDDVANVGRIVASSRHLAEDADDPDLLRREGACPLLRGRSPRTAAGQLPDGRVARLLRRDPHQRGGLPGTARCGDLDPYFRDRTRCTRTRCLASARSAGTIRSAPRRWPLAGR
jgi:hypothetical protein